MMTDPSAARNLDTTTLAGTIAGFGFGVGRGGRADGERSAEPDVRGRPDCAAGCEAAEVAAVQLATARAARAAAACRRFTLCLPLACVSRSPHGALARLARLRRYPGRVKGR